MDRALREAVLVSSVQGRSEELEQHILALEQELCGPEEPSISDRKAIGDGNDEPYETAGPRLAVRPIVQRKGKHEQPVTRGGHPLGVPKVTIRVPDVSTTYSGSVGRLG